MLFEENIEIFPSVSEEKTEVLPVQKSMTQVLDYRSALDRVVLPLKKQVCSLGMLLELQLLLVSQVAAVARGAFADLPAVTIPGSLRPGHSDPCPSEI